jgi:hypothetical protein
MFLENQEFTKINAAIMPSRCIRKPALPEAEKDEKPKDPKDPKDPKARPKHWER